MANLGVCPDCPKGTKERILVNGRCSYHAANPVPLKKNEMPIPPAAATSPKKTGAKGGKKRKAVPRVSPKLRAQNAEYSVRVAAWKRKPENKFCKAMQKGCLVHATDNHHKRGRGKYLLDETTWLPVCRNCHNWITEHSTEAITLGFSEKRNGRPSKPYDA